MKPLDAAKRRLAARLGRTATQRLVEAMLEDLVAALRAVPGLGPVAVVTPDPRVAQVATQAGARALLGPDPGLNPSLERGGREVAADAAALLVVLGDVAGAEPADVAALIAAAEAAGPPSVVLAPSSDGGTAALLRTPPDVIPPRFGPKSAEAHCTKARRAGAAVRTLRLPSLELDLDTVEDLERFLARPGGGPRTRALLRELGFGSRPW